MPIDLEQIPFHPNCRCSTASFKGMGPGKPKHEVDAIVKKIQQEAEAHERLKQIIASQYPYEENDNG